jgi:hypothetical protein
MARKEYLTSEERAALTATASKAKQAERRSYLLRNASSFYKDIQTHLDAQLPLSTQRILRRRKKELKLQKSPHDGEGTPLSVNTEALIKQIQEYLPNTLDERKRARDAARARHRERVSEIQREERNIYKESRKVRAS